MSDFTSPSASAQAPASCVTVLPDRLPFFSSSSSGGAAVDASGASSSPTEQRRRLHIYNTDPERHLAFKVKTNVPSIVSVDVASGVVAPGCSKTIRVYWLSSAASDSVVGAVVAVAARRLPLDTPLAAAASAALLGRELGEAASADGRDVVVPVVVVPRLSTVEQAEDNLAAAAAGVGAASAAVPAGAAPEADAASSAAALLRAHTELLYAHGLLDAEGAVASYGAAALALAGKRSVERRRRKGGAKEDGDGGEEGDAPSSPTRGVAVVGPATPGSSPNNNDNAGGPSPTSYPLPPSPPSSSCSPEPCSSMAAAAAALSSAAREGKGEEEEAKAVDEEEEQRQRQLQQRKRAIYDAAVLSEVSSAMERLRFVVSAGPEAVSDDAALLHSPSSPSALASVFGVGRGAGTGGGSSATDGKRKARKKWGGGRKKGDGVEGMMAPYLEALERDASFSSVASSARGVGISGSLASLRSRSPPPLAQSSSLTRSFSSGSISRIGSSGRILGVGEKAAASPATPSPARQRQARSTSMARNGSTGSLGAPNATIPLRVATPAVLGAAGVGISGGSAVFYRDDGGETPEPSSSPPSPTRSVASSAAGFPSPEPVADRVRFFDSLFSYAA